MGDNLEKDMENKLFRESRTLFREAIAKFRNRLLENITKSSSYTKYSCPFSSSSLTIKLIYKLNRMGLKQLPWGSPVYVNLEFVEL